MKSIIKVIYQGQSPTDIPVTLFTETVNLNGDLFQEKPFTSILNKVSTGDIDDFIFDKMVIDRVDGNTVEICFFLKTNTRPKPHFAMKNGFFVFKAEG